MGSVVNSGIEWLQLLVRFGIKPGLGRMKQMLESFGNPEQALTFFHVAGTNGKGSVCAILASLLAKGVLQTGLFVSPAFDGYRGRFSINGERISDSDFARLAEFVMRRSESVLQGESLTEFEALTLMAILYFYERHVDVVVWETGLGGRLDSTNVVMPVVTGITNVSYDHVQILGPTIQDIASEKAGIIKSNVPVVTAAQDVAYRVIEGVASEHGSTLLHSGRQFQVTRERYTEELQYVHYRGVFRDISGITLPLFGTHQCENLGVALAMYELGSYFGACPVLTEKEVRERVAAVKWPGRFEVFNQNGKTIILDGAHNPDGAMHFAGALRDYAEICGYPHDGWTMVIGIMRDKSIAKMLSHVLPLAKHIIFTSPDTARAASPEELFRYAYELNPSIEMEQIQGVTAAMARALELNQPIACWGSLYTVDAARKAIKTLPTD